MIRPCSPIIVCLLLSLVSLRAEEGAAEAAAEPKLVQAASAEELKTLAGQTATVEGKVTRIGSTADGGISFINLAPGVHGFVAVVFKANLEAFPGGLAAYKDQTLRVTGKIDLFKDKTPQIVVRSPEQIRVVPGAPAAEEPAAKEE